MNPLSLEKQLEILEYNYKAGWINQAKFEEYKADILKQMELRK